MAIYQSKKTTKDGRSYFFRIKYKDIMGITHDYTSPKFKKRSEAVDEEALYRIYAENKRWLGLVGDLITNLNYTATNRLILSEFGQLRAFCGQKCARGLGCNACYRMLNLADPDKIEKIKAKIKIDKIDKEHKNENLNI